jgi:hypothetical protein
VGYYIEVPSNHGKARLIIAGEALMRDGTGAIVTAPPYKAAGLPYPPASFAEIPEGSALICVVDNGIFEAAGFCYDEREFAAFTDPGDTRPKEWLLMDRGTAEICSGYRNRHPAG